MWGSSLSTKPEASQLLTPWEELHKNEWNSTKVFHNEKYGYSLMYPPTYLMPQFESPDQVFFKDLDLDVGGRLAVVIRPTEYKSAEEFIKVENEKVQKADRERGIGGGGGLVVEKRIKIAGYDALVTYFTEQLAKSSSEEKQNKTTFFVKDGLLFQISTNAIKHELIWDSFKFDQ